ncbi:MAG: tyrosine-type recombinase/integrase [Methylohalobius sp. ZOD2]
MKLSDLALRRLKPSEKTYRKADGGGLFIEVRPTGARYWRFAYRFAGKQKLLAVGTYPEISLAEARTIRDQARAWLREGKDPVSERRKEKIEREAQAANTFKLVALEWWEMKRGAWKERHATRTWRRIERDILPVIGNRPLPEIEPYDVLTLIKGIEARGAIETAKRQRAVIDSIFRYAIQTGRAKTNPATNLVGVVKSKRTRHIPAMSREALGPFLRQLEEFDRIKPITRLALKLTILTVARSAELRGARWKEFDLEAKEWRIPAKRMKMPTEHIIPLSRQAVEVVEQIKVFTGRSPHLFPSDRSFHTSMSENAMIYAMHRMGYKGIATPHGFRATFSTIANESGFNADWIEKALAHEERNQVRKAYHRALYVEERRKLMQWWADYLDGLKQGAQVVPIRS